MTFSSRVRSLFLRAACGSFATDIRRGAIEFWRRLTRGRHVVSVFLQIDDPYSYILSHYLPSLAKHYDIDLRLHLSQALGDDFQPAPELLAEYAVTDCKRLADELGVPFLDKGNLPPTEFRSALSDSVAAAGKESFDSELVAALAAFWRGDGAAAAKLCAGYVEAGAARAIIESSQRELQRRGHYNSAMLHYAGEWYWGIDRLHYLTSRLDELGVARSDSPDPLLTSIDQAMTVSLPVRPPDAAREFPPVEFFWSPRSPYSYLALQQCAAIADAFGLDFVVRPVLPMVMRGLKVPTAKLRYIAMDATREARRADIPYGRFADPVGAGAERVLAVFRYAETENKGRDFSLNAGVAIWADAVDVASEKGLRKVTGRTGLFWTGVVEALQDETWRESVEANRMAMLDSGFWGVPVMRVGDYAVWGQDRNWMLARHLEEMCSSGEGILI